jgi:hypothetical protein
MFSKNGERLYYCNNLKTNKKSSEMQIKESDARALRECDYYED